MDGIETFEDSAEDARELTYEVDSDLGEDVASATITPEMAHEIAPLADDAPVHKAVCMVDGCQAEVRYRLTASRAGFVVLDRRGINIDATLGMGADGRPVCPVDGHGEMTLADEQLPAADAFAQVAEKLSTPVQGDLPGIIQPFNFQGCYLELEQKAAEVDALHSEYVDAKEVAADAKKSWDKAAELYTKMALEFRRRRQAKGPDTTPTTAAPNTVRCVWDQQHPEALCPLCSPFLDRDEIVRMLGAEIAPMHANAHADQVLVYRAAVDITETLGELEGVLHDVSRETVTGWTPEQRAAVRAWVTAVAAAPDIVSEPPFPAELGRPHRAAVVGHDEQAQRCVACSQTIKTFNDQAEAYAPLEMVRLDCAGEQAEGHRYPARTAKRTRARRTTEVEAEPKPEKAAKKPAKKKGGR